jgi:hypothetical protein
MILNEDELSDNKETLGKYKEKLIDYEFSYDPKPLESLKILRVKLTAFKEYPLQKYLTRHKINNIRVISRIINALNDFSLQFFCSFSSDISPKTSFNSIDDDSLIKRSFRAYIRTKRTKKL